ncbi:TPA: hypothetical protein I8409_003830, partial [Kluyvera intermedia]|nr:hypothetical protein [Kluyvera intermedia]
MVLTLTGATAGAVGSPDKAQPHPGILKLPPVALALTGATAGAVGSPDKAQPHPGTLKLPP